MTCKLWAAVSMEYGGDSSEIMFTYLNLTILGNTDRGSITNHMKAQSMYKSH